MLQYKKLTLLVTILLLFQKQGPFNRFIFTQFYKITFYLFHLSYFRKDLYTNYHRCAIRDMIYI